MTNAKSKEHNIPQSPGKNTTYATGRRKEAVARVWVKPGSGKFTINRRDISNYLKRDTHYFMISHPLVLTNSSGTVDVWCTVKGGGISGQTGAICHGISHALVKSNGELRGVLKKAGMLTRDDRTVESKKYGRHKARRKPQFSKR